MPYIGDIVAMTVAMVLAVPQLAVVILYVWELKAVLLKTVA